MNTIFTRVAIFSVGIAAGFVLVLADVQGTNLSRADMSRFRGGGENSKECTFNCNAYNGYINICQDPFDEDGQPNSCEYCSLGSKAVSYVGTGENCTGDHKKLDQQGQPIDCGKQYVGECLSVGNCESEEVPYLDCGKPFPVTDQGPGPGDPPLP